MNCRSQYMLQKPEGSFNRGVFKSMGYSDENLKKPMIGIANAWSELVPGHFNLRQLADNVKRGIYMAGGTAAEFGVIGACDGTSQGHDGMHFILPSRDLIANDIEVMVEAHKLDGIVMLGSCDKIVPGMLMAAARLNIPSIILAGGPMLGGAEFDNRKSDLTSISEGLGMLKSGKITEEQYDELEETTVPTCGSCSFYGTANTMCCLTEAMGMSIPGSALIPAVFADRLRAAEITGKEIVNLVNKNIVGKDIITLESLKNAIKVLMATGGSTNAVLHLIAISSELEIDAEVMMELFDSLSETIPQVVKVNPASEYNMEDFYFAGGVPQVMKELEPLLNTDCMTVTARTVGENIAQINPKFNVNRKIIKTINNPFSSSKSLAILRGNIAPNTAVTKPSAIDPSMWNFTGIAKTYNSEEDAEKAILGGEIKEGDVVVIRYEGPKGGPGMREMFKAMKYLYGVGLSKKTALITDGRFSGTNNGCFVGHISPEAAEGGPLAIIKDGDKITIDISNKSIHLHVSQEEIQERFKKWKRPEPKFKKGYLALYSKLAQSADKGAIIKI